MIKELVNKLQIDENFHAAEEISSILKQQIQGDKGLIRKVKEQTENYRKSSLKTLIEEFANNRSNGFTDLDEQLNIFCNEMKKINDQAYAKLSYDYINLFANLTDIEKEYPEYHYVSQIITDEINHRLASFKNGTSLVAFPNTDMAKRVNKKNEQNGIKNSIRVELSTTQHTYSTYTHVYFFTSFFKYITQVQFRCVHNLYTCIHM